MRFVAALICALATIALSQAALAQAKQDFTLSNATGYVISHVYVSPSKADDWGDDILGKATMDDEEEVHITFSRAAKTCEWDLKVTYEDDNSSVVWHDFDLCKISKIKIKYDRKSDSTSASYE